MMANFPGEAGSAATVAPLSTRAQSDLEGKAREVRRYADLASYSAGTGQDSHSVLVDFDTFVNVIPPGPDPRTLYKPQDFDFSLVAGSAAVDAGTALPGINDAMTGSAPDLGAYERGLAAPHYGPRN
jgi:hypothetical protein